MGSVLESVASLTIGTIALLLILDLLGVNIAPFIASAGIAGVALGFGAQTLVKDFLSGIFMLVEDQYGVGDTITVGDISGVVESVALRVTAVRDANGVLWFIRNGEILKVGNQTQGWSRASVTVTVAYETNVADARAALTAAADVAAADPAIGAWLIDEPSVTGIDAMTSQTYTLSVGVKTEPAKQWDVSRVLRAAVRQELDKAGIVPWDEPQLVVVRPAETSPDE